MRALLVATLVFVAALAGCSGKKGGEEADVHYQCPNGGPEIHSEDFEDALGNLTEESQIMDFLKTKCPKGTGGSGSKTNTTSLAPNVPPVLKLNVTDNGGNATLVTMLDGNLTFSAAGSFDPDGQVSAIAITVKDSNQTRTRSLYDANAKKFTPQTLTFDRAGPVNITVAMVDDRAGFTTNVSHVYVNQVFELGPFNLHTMPPTADTAGAADACKGASGLADATQTGATVFDSTYFKFAAFSVSGVAGFIEAVPADAEITICDTTFTPISDERADAAVMSNNEAPLPAATGTETYGIGVYGTGAPADASVVVTVHYEPKPAAPAA